MNANDFDLYASINENGAARILKKSASGDSVINYRLTVRKELIDSIRSIVRKTHISEFHNFKKEKGLMYCGDKHSVRITMESGDALRFKYHYANAENPQFVPFGNLFREIQKDSAIGKQWGSENLGWLYLKRQSLSKYTQKSDSISIAKFHSR